MKKFVTVLVAFSVFAVVLMSFGYKDSMRKIENDSFGTGEVLKYKVHYGLINAAEGVIDVAPDIHKINGRPCYKVNVFGRTTGSFDFFLRVRDTWRSYVDTTSIVPQRFFRNIEEGKYRKKETIDFDHYRNLATVDKKDYKVPDNVQDIVSGFFYMRTIDFNQYRNGDEISVQGFFEDEVFDFTVTYRGKETVNTKAGKFRAIKLVPKMPKNKLFNGENAITVYLSDDDNKVPVLIQAEMFVGAVKVDLYEYKNLKNKISLVKS